MPARFQKGGVRQRDGLERVGKVAEGKLGGQIGAAVLMRIEIPRLEEPRDHGLSLKETSHTAQAGVVEAAESPQHRRVLFQRVGDVAVDFDELQPAQRVQAEGEQVPARQFRVQVALVEHDAVAGVLARCLDFPGDLAERLGVGGRGAHHEQGGQRNGPDFHHGGARGSALSIPAGRAPVKSRWWRGTPDGGIRTAAASSLPHPCSVRCSTFRTGRAAEPGSYSLRERTSSRSSGASLNPYLPLLRV